MALREWTLKRNCSLSPRQLALFYASLCAASFTIAGLFAMFGMHYVFEFALLEMVLVGVAFLIYARHAGDREHIALNRDWLLVELIEMERVRRFCLARHLTRIELPSSRHPLVTLEAAGLRVEVGQFLTERKRREFAQELKRELRRGVAAGG
ncbi:MAG TPA: DUF2244 domain-containing protein [Burkholderiaceae bacterium]|nr:DUF2244 domain-containing protein [Burkholderiaceae bacterium]